MLIKSKCILVLVLCVVSFIASGEENHIGDNLRERISDNQELFKTDPEKSLYNITSVNGLLNEAIESENHDAELVLLADLCEFYYLLKMDFSEMMRFAKGLNDKAIKYKSPLYEAKAHKYLALVYFFNDLLDKSMEEHNKALKVLEGAGNDDLIIMERANIHTAKANIYIKLKNQNEAVFELGNSVIAHDQLQDLEKRRGTKFMDYSNLGGAYLSLNLDSAEYYAKKSIALSLEKEYDHNLMFLNYLVLGSVSQKREDYPLALSYFEKAEEIKDNKHFMNIEEMYENIINVHQALGDGLAQKEYEDKLKDLKISITENKNQSLKNILEEKDDEIQTSGTRFWYLLFGFTGIFIISVAGAIYFVRRKSRRNAISEELTPEEYEEFINLASNNDPGFLLTFEQRFPEFSKKLLRMNPELTNGEIELLAMLKLNYSTKEIAQFKYVQPKTIQNRRYKVRKKMDLPSTINLYKWVDKI